MKTRSIIIAITLANMLSISTVVLGGDYLLSKKSEQELAQNSQIPQISESQISPTGSVKAATNIVQKSVVTGETGSGTTVPQKVAQEATAVNLNANSQEVPTAPQNTETVMAAPPPSDPPPPPPTEAPAQVSGCVITIDGASYDVTSFRSAHSGGDVFSCGADMSAAFWGQHGNKELTKMQRYRI